jgi:hypothetical protein
MLIDQNCADHRLHLWAIDGLAHHRGALHPVHLTTKAVAAVIAGHAAAGFETNIEGSAPPTAASDLP